MKIEIWSDVVCPFCYIGKRVFEKSLANLSFAKDLNIEWKSFQLDPNTPETLNIDHVTYLSEKKNMSIEQANEMIDFVTDRAKAEGLDYNLKKSIITNSFKAHVLIQFAKKHGKADEMEESLFKAFFIDGQNIGDIDTLILLGEDIGFTKDQLLPIFTDDELAYDVKADLDEARQIGVTGVPFFVFDRKYAISGAQPVESFVQTIEKSYNEWKSTQASTDLNVSNGESCSKDGKCN